MPAVTTVALSEQCSDRGRFRLRRRAHLDPSSMERRRHAVRPARSKTEMPAPGAALPGRPDPIPTAETHLRQRPPAQGPVSRRRRAGDVRHGLLLGRRADVLEAAGRLGRPRSATPAARTPNPTYQRGLLAAGPATTRSCSSPMTRGRSATRPCSRPSGRATTRPRACARATTSAPSTARASTPSPPSSAAAAEASRGAYQERLTAAGLGRITTEIVDAPAVLLRRGLPPAVPRQEPRRLLRHRRHRRELPDRARGRQLIGRGLRPVPCEGRFPVS